jgi:hypothetical protein
MNKQLAERLVRVFDAPSMEVLKDYIEERRQSLYKQLEYEKIEVQGLQGSLAELRTLEKIREYALAVINKG